MNTPIKSATNHILRESDCFGIDCQVAALNIFTDHGLSYQLAYAHFIYSEFGVNPELEQKPDAPPQRLVVHFSVAVITILGASLLRLHAAIQKNDLRFVQPGCMSPSPTQQSRPNAEIVVASVTIAFKEDES